MNLAEDRLVRLFVIVVPLVTSTPSQSQIFQEVDVDGLTNLVPAAFIYEPSMLVTNESVVCIEIFSDPVTGNV